MNVLQLSVVLVGVLCLINTVAVVALIRQVGVLHLRIQPVPGMTGAGGPAYGSELQLPATLSELARRDAARFLVGFVSPTCGVCGPVTAAFGRIAKSANGDTAVVLVIDASEQEANEYVRTKGVGFLPYIADGASLSANVPGSPWAVVADGSGKVIVSGGVNTLDNVEEMLAQADALIANPPTQATAAEGQVIREDSLTLPVESR
jgi:hypothetical protein